MVLWLKPFIMKMKTYLMSRSERVADLEKRQSNFELLRIVCMLLIMGLHITRQTKMGDYLIGDGVDYYYSILLRLCWTVCV